jgi:hypothetical protein
MLTDIFIGSNLNNRAHILRRFEYEHKGHYLKKEKEKKRKEKKGIIPSPKTDAFTLFSNFFFLEE